MGVGHSLTVATELPDHWFDNPNLVWEWGGSANGDRICGNCGGPVAAEGFEVWCCGGEYDCTDSNTQYSCPRCERVGYDW